MPKVPLGILAPPKCLSFHSFLCIPFLTRDCVTQLSRKLKHDYVFLVSVTLVSGERLSSAQVHIHFNDGGAPGGQYALHYKRFGRETEEIIYKGVGADDETGTAAKNRWTYFCKLQTLFISAQVCYTILSAKTFLPFISYPKVLTVKVESRCL